jgi:hypothetical protein
LVSSPLLPDDHYVLRKLSGELLPWMITGKRVGRQWFVRLAGLYAYTGDLAAALAGLGIGAPLVAIIQGKLPAGQNAVDVLRGMLGPAWFYVGVIAALVWVVIRVVVQREDILNRAVLAREYARSLNSLYAQLFAALATADPMPQIIVIQKTVDDKVQDAIKNRVWPFDPPLPPGSVIESDLKGVVDEIRSRFMSRWDPPPPGARR